MTLRLTFRAITAWPGDTPATPHSQRRRSQFSANYSATLELLERELNFLDAKNVIVEANCDPSMIRLDGCFRSKATLRGPGIIVSFDSKHGPVRYPCDKFLNWDCNLRAIALSLEALRSVDRYGVTRRGEQYQGWAKLEGPVRTGGFTKQAAAEWMQAKARDCCGLPERQVPTVLEIINDDVILRATYKTLVRVLHPDRRGSDVEFKQLQAAMEVLE